MGRPANGEDEGCDDDEEETGSLAEAGTWIKQTSGASVVRVQELESME